VVVLRAVLVAKDEIETHVVATKKTVAEKWSSADEGSKSSSGLAAMC
jgi:hypothetical protein